MISNRRDSQTRHKDDVTVSTDFVSKEFLANAPLLKCLGLLLLLGNGFYLRKKSLATHDKRTRWCLTRGICELERGEEGLRVENGHMFQRFTCSFCNPIPKS